MQNETSNDMCKRKYKKKNDFKINIIFNENGENLANIIERAFSNYILRNNSTKVN